VTTICVLYPDLLGTYGDGGNGLAIAERARRRGLDVELVSAGLNDEVPTAALYLIGGGEDGPQRLAADLLRTSSFAQRVGDGANVLAVCAGLQILGTTFCVEGDDEYEGLGLVDVVTSRGERRSVGELATRVGDQLLVGFENHGGRTILHGVEALGSVVKGRGNDGKLDGYRTKNIWATYAHGPVLAMNPWFCDEILAAVYGVELEPLASVADRLYEERRRVLSA
jgi:lipid II isoglutaminyl synthase (glutamine-hydrolysing)